jgi:hypothetical protein
MPKKTVRYKRGKPPMRTRAGIKFTAAPAAHSVKDLLARHGPQLQRLTDQAALQQRWREWLMEVLPAELGARVSGVIERAGTLVVFAESAAWSTRLRYALLELEGPLRAAHPQVESIEVRVLPRS